MLVAESFLLPGLVAHPLPFDAGPEVFVGGVGEGVVVGVEPVRRRFDREERVQPVLVLDLDLVVPVRRVWLEPQSSYISGGVICWHIAIDRKSVV